MLLLRRRQQPFWTAWDRRQFSESKSEQMICSILVQFGKLNLCDKRVGLDHKVLFSDLFVLSQVLDRSLITDRSFIHYVGPVA